MTTAQDQQSRAEFEAHMRKLSPCVRLYRHTCDGGDKYRTVTVQRNWELWQAARALPAGMEPLCYLRPAAATTPARAWQAWENDGTAQPVYTAAQVQAMGRVPPGWQVPLSTALGRYQHARDVIGGCTDGGCVIKKPKGMHTNGGCRCLRAQHVASAMVHWGNELAKAVQVALAAAPRTPAAQEGA